MEAYVSLATNDYYARGALTLGHSLRLTNTTKRLVLLVTNAISSEMREHLLYVWNELVVVEELDSRDCDHLALLSRPELGVTFSKLHVWRLTQFFKCVFLDADTLVLQNVDELFEREELSAAPDIGWPDTFNSGVFVFEPSIETFNKLVALAKESGSFDGGDQGLLNLFWSDWATKDIKYHLPFIYNVTPNVAYGYRPAFLKFRSKIKIIHFIGAVKPWQHHYVVENETVVFAPGTHGSQQGAYDFIKKWWEVWNSQEEASRKLVAEARQERAKKLQQEVTCPICHNHYQDPKMLPCLHTYCKKCIQDLAQITGINQPFPCPECQANTLLPQNDPNQLPNAFFIYRKQEMRTILEVIQGSVDAKCEMCNEGKAIAFCHQCVEFCCDKCTESHRRMKHFVGHKTSTIGELKEGKAQDIASITKPSPPLICKVHDEEAKLYCYDCKIFICRDCMFIDHKGHKFEFVKKAGKEAKDLLLEHLVPLVDIQAEIKRAMKNIEHAKSKIGAMGKSMITSIQKSFQELEDILSKHKKELLAEATTCTQEKMGHLAVQSKELELSEGNIKSLTEFVKWNVENAAEHEIMTIYTFLLNHIDDEAEKYRSTDLEPVEKVDRTVLIGCAKELKSLCQEKASIISLPVDVDTEEI